MKITLAGFVAWARQVTTGLGATGISGTLGLYFAHQISGTAAAILVVASLVPLLWPEANKAKVAVVAQAVVPAAEVAVKDMLVELAAKKFDGVTTGKDALAMLSAIETALANLPAQPAPVGVALAGAAIAAA
jgi:hypothetical protein